MILMVYAEKTSKCMTTANQIIDALVARRGDAIYATELAFSGGARRCDFWTITANSSSGFKACAYEIKTSRADFKRDTSIKQREARLYSDQFYYVTPANLIASEEVPEWAGLIEYADGKLKTVIHAPYRDKDGPTWELVVSLIRNSGQINRDTDLIKLRLREAERKIRCATEAIEKSGRKAWKFGL
jgi:hypothetical protein